MKRMQNPILSHGRAALSAAFLAVIVAVAPVAQAEPAATQGAPAAAKARRVDINSADAKTLEDLPGIGPVLAQRIIEGRPFKNAAELAKVKGMNQSKIDELKGEIVFGPAAKAARETPSKADNRTSTTKPSAPAAGAASRVPAGGKININTATSEQLDTLPGIGPVRAKAIIDYREQKGKFKTIEEIKNVSGIKEGEFAKIQDKIKVSN